MEKERDMIQKQTQNDRQNGEKLTGLGNPTGKIGTYAKAPDSHMPDIKKDPSNNKHTRAKGG
jgi:hypothetical protein